MEWDNRSVWKGTADQYGKVKQGQYGKVQQVSMKRYSGSVWKGTVGQYRKVQLVCMERYNRSV